jgi:Ca2+-binding RTX toxin-like protein
VVTWAGPARDGGGDSDVLASIYRFDIVAPAAPAITGTSVSVDQVTITGAAEPASVVRILDAWQVPVATGTADAQGRFQLTTVSLPDGSHALVATATDGSMNTSTASDPASVSIHATFQSATTAVLAPEFRHLVLLGTADADGTGNALDNTLVGNAGANMLAGLAGNDTYVVQDRSDRVVEVVGEGVDTVYSSVGMVLPDHVENLLLTGSLDLDAAGNAGNNVLGGNTGVNALMGGAGDDIYLVQGGEDFVVERPGEGFDLIVSTGNHALPDFVEALMLHGSAGFGIGNTGDNVMIGNGLGNTFFGGGGTDTMAGGAGNDVYAVDSAQDAVLEHAG